MNHGRGIVEVHPRNLLGKFDLLCHPWKFGLFDHFGWLFLRRLKSVLQSLQRFEVGIILGVLDSEYGNQQFLECVNNGICRCDLRLSDVLVLEEDHVG